MNEHEKRLREKISRATPNLRPRIDVEDVAAILEELDSLRAAQRSEAARVFEADDGWVTESLRLHGIIKEAREVSSLSLIAMLTKTLPSCHHPDCLGSDNPKPAMWWSVERDDDRDHTFQRCDEHKTADKYGLKYATNPTPWAGVLRKAVALLGRHPQAPEIGEVMNREHFQPLWLSACRIERTLKTDWSLTTTARVVAALLDEQPTKARLIEILRAVDVDPNEIGYEIADIVHRLNDDGSEKFGGDL